MEGLGHVEGVGCQTPPSEFSYVDDVQGHFNDNKFSDFACLSMKSCFWDVRYLSTLCIVVEKLQNSEREIGIQSLQRNSILSATELLDSTTMMAAQWCHIVVEPFRR